MTDIIICVLTNMYRIYLIRKFILIFSCSENIKAKSKEIVAYCLFFCINTAFYFAFRISWVNLLCNLIGIFCLTHLYDNSLKMKLFITCSIYSLCIGCDIIGTLLILNYEEGQSSGQAFQIIIVFLISICVLLVEKLVNYRKNRENVQSIPLMLVPLSSIFMICILFYNTNNVKNKVIIMICIGLLVINILVFYLYNMILHLLSERYENEVLKQKVTIYANQINVILQSEERVKTLRHDLKHHLTELTAMAKSNRTKDLEAYIDKMKGSIYNPEEIVSSGNLEIDGVLNYMLQKARNELNFVESIVQLPEKLEHSFDLVVVLGNLLENAIDAAKQTNDKTLSVVLLYRKGILKGEIINSCQPNEVERSLNNKEFLITTKKDKERHGIGLRSVYKIIEDNDGALQIFCDENMFHAKFLLYINKTE